MARILIVEDSPTQMEALKRVIEGMGHLPLAAEDGDKALAMAIQYKPDLILMDIIMPNTNGFQATRAISKHSDTAGIPIVILSTKGEQTDKAWGLRQGAKAYLTKPCPDKDLIQTIREFVKD